MDNEVVENRRFIPADALDPVFPEPWYIRAMHRGLYVDAWLLPSCPAL